MHDKRGCVQITLPDFLRDLPYQWAEDMRWFTTVPNSDGDGNRPHISMLYGSIVAALSRMSKKERNKLLRAGAKRLLAEQESREVSGRQRVRLLVSDDVRPMGVKVAKKAAKRATTDG